MSRSCRVVVAGVLATIVTAAPAAAMPIESHVTASSQRQASSNTAKIERIASSQIGAPYSYGGTSPAGFDCSGFTSWVYSHVGVTLPHSSSAQYALAGAPGYQLIPSIEELRTGDLVFHATGGSGVGHAGIYIGDGRFISATSSSGVQVRSLFDSYWGPLWVGGVRVTAR